MKCKGLTYLIVFGIVLLSTLTIVVSGSSEILMVNMNASGSEKAFDPRVMDPSVKPGDNFYEYANEAWIKSHPVPADKSRYGVFDIVNDRTYDRIKEIVEGAANNTSAPEGGFVQKIGDFYRMGMDITTRDQQRLNPIEDEIRLIDNISNISDVQNVSTQMMDYGMNPLFSMYAAPDVKNSKIMIATLSQGGLSLPGPGHQDIKFYFMQDNESIKIREQYLAHVARMFVLLGDSPEIAENNSRTVMRIETRLASASFSNMENANESKTYNKMSLANLQAFAPGIDWSRFFEAIGCPDVVEVNILNPSFFKELSNAFQEESVADWKTFLRWKLILAASPYLSSDLQKEHFDFYDGTVQGLQEMLPHWKRVIDEENIAMGEDIGRLYVEKYFDASSRGVMQEIVSNLKEAFRERIQNLTWMEPETRKKALMKLKTLDVQVGYPDEWLNYSELKVENDSFVMNALRAAKFRFHHGPIGIDSIGKPVNRKLWLLNPQDTNAYAYPGELVIVFPAGILQPPFFDKDADDAVNYGAIGSFIAHEMTHHFDNQGRMFDASGNLTDWWTSMDADNFEKSTRVLVDEYNNFEVLPDLHVNGKITLNENIADFCGLTMTYHAYKLSLRKEPRKIDGFTGDQRLFLSFAQIWRESDKNEYLRMLTLTDMHSPSRFRVNGVVFNMPEFYRAFPDVKSGDKLYRAESKRPVIW